MMENQIYEINFSTGRLEPKKVDDKNDLKPGQILQLNGYNNPRFVITENQGINEKWTCYGVRYSLVNLETLLPAFCNAHELEFIANKKDNRIQKYIMNESKPVIEVNQIIALSKRAVIDNDNYQKEKAEKRQAEINSLPAKYPFLTPGAGASKNIKTELKKVFPRIKFSVRCPHYGTVDIDWNDGPTCKQVEEISDKYAAGNFNGMEDIYEYNDNLFGKVFGDAKYIFTNRHESPELNIKAAAELGIVLTSGIPDNYGNLPGLDRDQSIEVYRQAHITEAL